MFKEDFDIKMNDVKIIVGSHGALARELVNSARMIVGDIENVKALCLEEGMSPEEYLSMVDSEIQTDTSKKIFCLVDLFGGTPCNVMSALSRKYGFKLI